MRTTIASGMGSKFRLAPTLNRYMPSDKKRHVSGFAGRVNEILAMRKYDVEICNDKDKDIFIMLKNLCQPGNRDKMIRQMLTLNYFEDNFMEFKELTAVGYMEGMDEINYATAVWYMFLTSFNGDRRQYSPDKSLEIPSNFHRHMIRKVPTLYRLDGVQVWNLDIFDLIEQELKNPALCFQTNYYLDSPYLDNKAGYQEDMSSELEHKRYCHSLARLTGNVTVSGYDNSLYDQILVDEYGFYKTPLKNMPVSMEVTPKGQKKQRKLECIWTNYDVRM